MGLNTALQIGRSGLLSSQRALQTAGNNLANVGTEGYHRQSVNLAPTRTHELQQGVRIGTGVGVDSIQREVNQAVESRLRGAVGDEHRSQTRQQLLERVESIENELSDAGLSDRMNQFFNNWNELANKPQDGSLRRVVVEEARSLSGFVQDMRTELTKLRTQVDDSINSSVDRVNELLNRVENLNEQIGGSEASGGEAMALRDERDRALKELSGFLDISTQQRKSGEVDVYVGSEPIVMNGDSRGVELAQREQDGKEVTRLVTRDNKAALELSTGKLAAQLRFDREDLDSAIDTVDTFAKQLIYQVNRKHSQGQGLELIDRVTSDNAVKDATAALDSSAAGLTHAVEHGSFKLHVTQRSTGQRQSHTIDVDLDGIGSDTTLQDIASAIDGKANVSASVTSGNRLSINTASDDFAVSFSDDSSGALAALGVNSFFTGKDATDIAVSDAVRTNPNRLAASGDHRAGDNSTALAIAGLRDAPVGALNDQSLPEYWRGHVERVGVELSEAKEQTQADQAVRENLQQQQQSISGVNVDEQTIDLMQYQRAFQASARFVSTVDQMMQTLLQSV
jgi:flagellar hook-associated protein 1 FlgK